ncbi:MAG: sialate O-acetylesterase [Phycisphaeraceae bacterium JB051]
MKHTAKLTSLLFLMMAILLPQISFALQIPKVFATNMVLQQQQPIPVWGTAKAGSKVTVTFADQSITGKANRDGKWMVKLPGQPANHKPQSMTITGDGQTITFENILIGEVWVCSGQSNMQWSVKNSNNAQEEIANATDSLIRLCRVPNTVAHTPQDDANISWNVCSPQTVPGFTAVGYFFGRHLRQSLNVPVGLINTSWGGTPAEAWTSNQALQANPVTADILKRWDKVLENYPQRLAEWEVAYKKWQETGKQPKPYHDDPGNMGFGKGYAKVGFDDSAWKKTQLPGLWEDIETSFDGVAWYRRTIKLPPAMQGKALDLSFCAIDDFDVTYVNGFEVGQMTHPDAWSTPRRYTVPAWVNTSDTLTIAVRVFDHYGGGGFNGSASEMNLSTLDGNNTLSLAGPWKWHVENRMPNAPGNSRGGPRKPRGPNDSHRPANLFNAMINPLVPYGIRGAIWYQGETNAGRAKEYRTLLPVMIENWRDVWGQGDFPFGVVQLANFMATTDKPSDPAWAHLRDAQLNTSLTVPNVGQAVIIDIGEAKDIHPRNKQDVGKRLGFWAQNKVYGQTNVIPSGPVYQSMKVKDNKVTLTFDVVGKGLKTTDGKAPAEFIITDDMRNWYWADAKITSKNSVTVWSDKVTKPVAVRYAWANNPVNPNLTNSANIPATPFRTDAEPK